MVKSKPSGQRGKINGRLYNYRSFRHQLILMVVHIQVVSNLLQWTNLSCQRKRETSQRDTEPTKSSFLITLWKCSPDSLPRWHTDTQSKDIHPMRLKRYTYYRQFWAK